MYVYTYTYIYIYIYIYIHISSVLTLSTLSSIATRFKKNICKHYIYTRRWSTKRIKTKTTMFLQNSHTSQIRYEIEDLNKIFESLPRLFDQNYI